MFRILHTHESFPLPITYVQIFFWNYLNSKIRFYKNTLTFFSDSPAICLSSSLACESGFVAHGFQKFPPEREWIRSLVPAAGDGAPREAGGRGALQLFLDVQPEFSGSARAWPGSARQRHWTEPSSLTWTVGSSGRARIGSVQPVWLVQMFFFIKIWHGKDR
jgi:hypothetical protein